MNWEQLYDKANAIAPISLQEINTTNQLQTRIDRKYVLNAAQTQALLNTVSGKARALNINGQQHSRYDSTYSDTPDFQLYYLARTGRRRRAKIRERTYTNTGARFLELKTKSGRHQTVKTRIPLTSEQGYDRNACRWLSQELFNQQIATDISHAEQFVSSLQPVLTTSYERVTLAFDDIRVTIDTDLDFYAGSSFENSDSASNTYRMDYAVVETKTAQCTSDVDRWLWQQGIRPMRMSKFALGMSLLYPQLPANRWHRTLTYLGFEL